jgi:hypothetical protein
MGRMRDIDWMLFALYTTMVLGAVAVVAIFW